MMIALLFLPMEPACMAAAFISFRLFDILKPFPIRMAERLPSPFGVVLDDVIAGIYANITVRAGAALLLKAACR
jgi:phosphatidylglycerophosphatase A